jgi:hypothetical protein
LPGGEVMTSIGPPIGRPSSNYIMVGDWQTGQLFSNYQQTFASLPAIANRKFETYEIPCTLRVWNGDTNPVARLGEVTTLIDGVMGALANDPNASGAISPSGTWEVRSWEIASTGPFEGKGWGILATFLVAVFNVQIAN